VASISNHPLLLVAPASKYRTRSLRDARFRQAEAGIAAEARRKPDSIVLK